MLHELLVRRADVLIGCTDGSADQDELEAIGEAIEAYVAGWQGGRWEGLRDLHSGLVTMSEVTGWVDGASLIGEVAGAFSEGRPRTWPNVKPF